MAWDKNLPDGAVNIAQGDDAIRANNTAIEAAMDFEHEFATGGVVTGRHKFQLATKATIDALTDPTVDGALALASDPRPNASLVYFDLTSGDWLYVDVGTGDVARIDEIGSWTKMQSSLWDSVTPSGGFLAVNLAESPSKYATITTDITFSNPINPVASHSSNVMFMVTWSGAGHTVSWGSEYVSSNGTAIPYSTGSGDITVFYMSRLQDGNTLVTSLSDVKAIP